MTSGAKDGAGGPAGRPAAAALRGKKLYVSDQFSCSSSRANLRKYEDFVTSHGAEGTPRVEEADIVLIDTCAFNQMKEQESLDFIAASQRRAGDRAKVIVCGCLAGINPERLREGFRGEFFSPKNERQLARILGLADEDARFFGGTDPRGRLVGTAEFTASSSVAGGPLKRKAVARAAVLLHRVNNRLSLRAVPVVGRLLACSQHTNPEAYTLTISRGCLGTCSYCAIPLAKGRTASHPPGLLVERVREVVEGKVSRRIVLTSEDTGAYGKDLGLTFVDLLAAIERIPGDFEIFVEFFDPRWLGPYREGLAGLLAKGRVRYLQLPVQSGSNAVLERMRRAYRIEQVLPVVRELRRAFPHVALGSQFIAGFPGESEADFAQSRAVVREGLFDFVSVFEFSDRPGAATQLMPDHLPADVVKRRAAVLRADWRRSLLPLPGKPPG